MRESAHHDQMATYPRGPALEDITVAHAQLMHWILDQFEQSGQWPDETALRSAPMFEKALVRDLQYWQLLAWDVDGRVQARDNWIRLPVIGAVAAGVPIEAIEHQQGQLVLPLELFRERPTYLLRVRGDSMKDAGIFDGDLIAVRKSTEAGEGRIVVARVDNEVTVKRLQMAGRQVALMPENADYQPIMVAPEDLVIEGLFVGVVRERKTLH